jgi:hypothetical protein
VLRDSPVIRAISRALFLSRRRSRRIQPIRFMVITAASPLHKKRSGAGSTPGSAFGRRQRAPRARRLAKPADLTRRSCSKRTSFRSFARPSLVRPIPP